MSGRKLTRAFVLVLLGLWTTSCGPSVKVAAQGSTSSLLVITSSLHLAYIKKSYQANVRATGGTPPYRWTVSSGSIPAGLSLNSTSGRISGTPTQGGTFSPTITATDLRGASASKRFSLEVFEQPLDQYGGLMNAPSPAGATRYFRMEKRASGRWNLVTPAGNYMWLNSVYVVGMMDGGKNYTSVVAAKYPSRAAWAQQANSRLKAWGFNAIGPYAELGGSNVLPVSTYGGPPNSVAMPFLRGIDLSSWCMRTPSYKTKNLYNGLNPAVVAIGRDFPDVFDPVWASCANYFAANGNNVFTPNLPRSEPWMIGTWLGDADFLYGFGRGPNTPGGGHAHLGWIAAVTNPNQTSGPGGDLGGRFSYSNTVVYTKQQWQSYLQNKHTTITALDNAWGSNYTTFGSAGGWPKKTTGGTGLMDEDGSSSWMGNGTYSLIGASPNAQADMDAFLSQIAGQYFSVAVSACKAAYPHHLVFGPGSLNAQTYSQVLQEAGQYLDVLEVWVEPKYIASLANAYNVSGKPVIVWTTLTSQKDTEAKGGWAWGTGACTGDYDFCTQAERGTGYQNLVNNYWNTQAADGTYPVIGLDWWEWADKVVGGENMNFGLVSLYDNAYDGLENQTATGADSWGYRTEREPRNHGNFLDAVTQENLKIMRALVGAR